MSSVVECIDMADAEGASPDGVVLLDPRPFRPFKSSEEYLYAMKVPLNSFPFHSFVLDR